MDEPYSSRLGKRTFSATGQRDYLRRLPAEAYRGRAYVHWSMGIENRRSGWLNNSFHVRWREILLHAVARYHLACPAYVLMPDHWHILWIGLGEDSDQRKAAKFFREYSGHLLRESGCQLQKQAYDHVLRDQEQSVDAFSTVAGYILANPERANLSDDWRSYPHLGAIVAGYPVLDTRAHDFWEIFWSILS